MSHAPNPFLEAVAAAQQVDELPKRRQHDTHTVTALHSACTESSSAESMADEANSGQTNRARVTAANGAEEAADRRMCSSDVPHCPLLAAAVLMRCVPR